MLVKVSHLAKNVRCTGFVRITNNRQWSLEAHHDGRFEYGYFHHGKWSVQHFF